MSGETVYEMMVKIGLEHSVLMSGLTAIGTKLGSLHNVSKDIATSIGGWGPAITAAGAALVAAGLLDGFLAIGKAGGEVNHQLNLMKGAKGDLTDAELAQILMTSQQTATSNPLSTTAENLKTTKELYSVFGDLKTVTENLPGLSKINSALDLISDHKHKDAIYALAKALEQLNLTAVPANFNAMAESMFKVSEVTGGKVDPEKFRQAIQYGRIAALGWDQGFMEGVLPRLIQSTSASSAGTSLMSVYSALHGKMTKDSNAEFERLGLGSPRHGGPLKDRSLADANVYEWIQKDMMPAILADIASKGITDPAKIKEAVLAEIQAMFGNRVAAAIVGEMSLGGRALIPGVNAEGIPNSPFEKDMLLPGKAMSSTAFMAQQLKDDLPAIMESFNKQWTHLKESLGGPLMQPGGPVLSALGGMRDVLKSIAEFNDQHPGAINSVSKVMTELARALKTLFDVIHAGGAALKWIDEHTSTSGGPLSSGAAALLDSSKGDPLARLSASILDGIKNGFNSITKSFDPAIIPQRFEGNSPIGSPRLMPASFDPGNKKKTLIQHATVLNIDGHQLAMATSEVLEDLYEHPIGPPDANGWDHFRAQGNQTDT